MSASFAPHLNFHGNARQALEFYGTVLGAEPMIRTYGEFGMPGDLPDTHKAVWGQAASADGVRIMAYDVPDQKDGPDAQPRSTTREHGLTQTDQSFFLSLSGSTLDEATGFWDKLTDGAHVVEPLAASAWSAGFGMPTDRFGVTWIVDVQQS